MKIIFIFPILFMLVFITACKQQQKKTERDQLNVTYKYRIGDYEPFKFYRQTLVYKIDTSGKITTEKVFERAEEKNGN